MCDRKANLIVENSNFILIENKTILQIYSQLSSMSTIETLGKS